MRKVLRVGFASVEDASSVSSWSGIPLNILETLQKRPDVEVELISPLGQRFKSLFVLQKLRSKLSKQHYDWKRENLSLLHFAAQIETVFKNRDLDVIFSTSSIPGTRLKPSVPFVFWTDATFHIMEGYYRSNSMPRTLRLGRLQEEAALRRANFACYSSDWAADGARRFASHECVKVLPFGPNLPIEHSPEDVAVWIQHRGSARQNGCTLLFVGIGWERKGGAIAMEAARKLNEAGVKTTLRVVGSNPPGPMPSFVETLGFINKQEPAGQKRLMDLYRTSDIFILPSRAEAFGVVVSEAAAFGMPSLVADTGGLAETVRDGATGFRLPLSDNGALFAVKAQAILKDYETFANAAYKEFLKRLNWEVSVSHLVELMRQASTARA